MKTKNEKPFDYRTIQSFEDACKKVGVDPTALPDVSMIPEDLRESIVNMYKLYIIYKAINNGWEPDWGNSKGLKCWPWFLVRSSGSGFGFSFTCYEYDYPGTGVGSRLCTDTVEKAKYIGKQFESEYKAIFLINK